MAFCKGLKHKHEMVNMKRWGLTLLAAGCMAMAKADLVVLERSGAARSFVPAEVRRITFDGGRMCVQSSDGTTHFWEVSAVRKCYFGTVSESPTTIGSARAASWKVCGQHLMVSTDSEAVLTVHNTEGRLLLMRHVPVGMSAVNLAELPVGIYVVRMNGETLKLMMQ